jgi:hypothetical protein
MNLGPRIIPDRNVMEHARRAVRGPWFATAITLLVIIAGLLGSIYSPEIRDAFPFYWGRGPICVQAVIFWVVAGVAALAYFFREQSVAREQHKQQDRALYRSERLERLIRTLPPENFLELVGDFYTAAAEAVDAAFAERTAVPHPPEVVEQSIRHLLRLIAALAQQFDGNHTGVEYAANIMMFKETKALKPAERVSLASRLLFCDEAVSIDNLRGVLELQTKLSAIAADAKAEPDPRMGPIALPIPVHSSVHERYKVMPGAPLAFIEREPDVYTDTSLLAEWCEENGDFTRQVVEEVRSHFRDSHVRAFVSIPLFAPEDLSNADAQPVAILNIHATREGLLRGESEPLAHFVQILRPFHGFLVDLLNALPTPSVVDSLGGT